VLLRPGRQRVGREPVIVGRPLDRAKRASSGRPVGRLGWLGRLVARDGPGIRPWLTWLRVVAGEVRLTGGGLELIGGGLELIGG
jgi:hypothetical protein